MAILRPGGDKGYEYDATARYRSATVSTGNHMVDLKAAIAQRFAMMNQTVKARENGQERKRSGSSDWSEDSFMD